MPQSAIRISPLGLIASLALIACTQSAGANDAHSASIGPRVAVDENPNPRIVEVRLVAEEQQIDLGTGGRVTMFTYNGMTPGPTIEGNVGDTVVVHLENRLPMDTTIHWHGVEVPANMDGSNISQGAVPPGGSYRYEFKLLDAATFWYHPHIRTNEQIEMGLYGALIVHDPEQVDELDLPESEHVLLLDDILLDDAGQVAPPFPSDPLENTLLQVNGREGNVLLVNGHVLPERLVVRGVPHRLRLINTANTRFMRVSIAGHRMYRISDDGGLLESAVEVEPIGMIPDPHHPHRMVSDPDPSKGVLLTPGERVDVVFTPTGSQPIDVEWHDIARGRHTAFYKPDGSIGLGHDHNDGQAQAELLMRLIPFGPNDDDDDDADFDDDDDDADFDDDDNDDLRELAVIDPIDATGAPVIKLELGHTPPNAHGDITFFVQRKVNTGQCNPSLMLCPLPFDKVTADDAPSVMVGETRILEIANLTGGDHNFHLHGFFFQLIDVRFIDMDEPANNYVVPAERIEVQDTLRIPARPGAAMRSRTVTRVAVRFDDPGREGQIEAAGGEPGPYTSGGWVFHCHILDHADRGMMSYIQVRNP